MTVPRLWPDETVVILATGPSLTPADVEACRGQRVIAVKDAIRLAPWADVLYACDATWWQFHAATVTPLPMPKYSLEAKASPWATVLRNTGTVGLELDPSGLRTGRNSGYQAINLAVHLGARRIVLLGYDLQVGKQGQAHWFGPHPYSRLPPKYHEFRSTFPTLVDPLRAAGVEVVNASRATALECFPRVPLASILEVPA